MILRYVVALPCYNNSETIEKVILDVIEETKFPILVIDDGSDISIQQNLKSQIVLEAIKSGRLHFVRHEQNLGKGAAIQSAFAWGLAQGITHVLTMDTDGQHLASEISKVIQRSLEHPWSLIIGSRKWKQNVPGASKFGRKFSNFWVNFETGYNALDSQSGFRAYPLFHVQNFSFFTKKYDFEIEVLIRLLWNDVDVQEVDIEVYYPPGEERISHFNKFSDNVRISLLNAILVTVSLLRGHLDPLRSGLALGLGVVIGMTPFFGLHTGIVAVAALAFRLNFLLVLIGSQVSLPLFVPFVAIGSIKIGHTLLRPQEQLILKMPSNVVEAFEISKNFFIEWLVGGLLLGLVVGCLVGGAYYLFKKWYFKKKSQGWTGKTRGGAVGNGFLRMVLKYFGLRAGYFCLYFIVPYFYLLSPRSRRSISQYWRALEPKSSWWHRQKQILKHFYVFGQVLMDRVFQSYHEKLVFGIHRDAQYIDKVAESGRGWVFMGAHVGGWDISSLFFKKDPRSARLGMVHFIGQGMTFDKVLRRGQETTKVDSIESNTGEGSLITVKSFLEENRHVGFLADRAIGTQIELVSFLGKLAPFETRPFRIAAMCRAPLIYTYTFKTGDRDYKFYATGKTDLKYPADHDRRLQIFAWTEEFVRDLEKQMRKHPHQWFNFYPFWSSLPKQVPGASSGRQDHCLLEGLGRQLPKVIVQESAPKTNASPK